MSDRTPAAPTPPTAPVSAAAPAPEGGRLAPATGEPEIIRIPHAGVTLALHRLRPAPHGEPRRPLLLLHGLGESTPTEPPETVTAWPGEIWGLDFTGHGQSSIPGGGGYTAEVLMADVDHALAHTGPATIVGRGMGAYVALLIAGARPAMVRGIVMEDGTGLAGGGPSPHTASVVSPAPGAVLGTTPDPYALMDMSHDVRPGDYATTYAEMVVDNASFPDPIVLAGVVRPPWLVEVAATPGVTTSTTQEALTRFATLPIADT